ncbi:T9SS type A sorting domain-containing protein [Winogradskyella forsetii]|uniref:T9SS type A sorting domain-containing protein n=1 Tax=Winogradskyella forsetii TaxID=2686077 RepID=UPI0015BDA21F|nr:T9SS type A sorting domain-containing protein [Winogradskyella forsetii]
MKSKLRYTTLLFSVLFLNFSFAQQTYVPDDIFEQYLIDQGYDTVLDNYVTTDNLTSVTSVDLNGTNVTDLSGIGDFLALTTLNVSSTLILTLDVTKNTALTLLNANDTALSSINLSFNPALDTLYVDNTFISSLDLSANTALSILDASDTLITNIDVSANTLLTSLSVANTSISSLDISSNTALTFLTVFNSDINSLDVSTNVNLTTLKTTNTPKLNCIAVADQSAANSGLGVYFGWEKDEGCSYSEICDRTYVPDDVFEQYLIAEGFDSGPLNDYVPFDNIKNIPTVDLNNTNVIDLTGIQDFTLLAELNVSNTAINTLDVSSFSGLTNLNTLNTPNLDCINVDDEDAANAGTGIYTNWEKDLSCGYSENCAEFLSNSDFNISEAFVGPNPVKDELNIILKNNGTLNDVSLYDVSGKLILKTTNKNVSTSHLASGLYLVKITTDKGSFTRKLIKS